MKRTAAIPAAFGLLRPGVIVMLGASELPLRQGFAFGENACARRAARLACARGSRPVRIFYISTR